MTSNTWGAGLLVAAIATLVASGSVAAHGGAGAQGCMGSAVGADMGHGMMGGQGMGHGMMGGHGMGHDMMGGQGKGQDMMGGHGMGHGMMGGQGKGQDMMGGQGMGHGMMGGALDLSNEQRKQINRIHTALRKQHWALQGERIDAQGELSDLYADEPLDGKRIGAAYAKIFDLQRQMIEAAIDARNQHRAVLTEEQREQLQQGSYDSAPSSHGHGEVRTKMPSQMGHRKPSN